MDDRSWPEEPTDLNELETHWIPTTKHALLAWLQETRDRARQASDAQRIKPCRYSFDAQWETWRRHADLETGILPEVERAAYHGALKPLSEDLKKVHEDLHTWHKHIEFLYAQAAWEDFLYFQNEWNRRGFVSDKDYSETAAEAEAARYEKLRKGTGRDVSAAEYMVCPNLSPVADVYYKWRDSLISRYAHFGLGSRESIPKRVGPDIAHRYSQPARGTVSLKQEGFRLRHERLKQKFPGRGRRFGKSSPDIATAKDVDKQYPTSNERSGADVGWTLDHAAFSLKKDTTDRAYMDSSETRRLLPKDHVLHHGVLESSFDWPTSFDAEDWGNFIAVTASRRMYVYDEEDYISSDGQKKRRFKRDEQNRLIRSTEACGYMKVRQEKEKTIFVHDLNADGSVKGRVGNQWIGRDKTVLVDEYINDPLFDHPEPNIRYRSRNEFKIVVIKAPPDWRKATRYQRHEQADKGLSSEDCVDQLSDTEAPDCVNFNVNFCRSGNVNGQSGTSEAEAGLAEDELVDTDDDSDDEDDPFTRSYLECAGPVCEGANPLLVELED